MGIRDIAVSRGQTVHLFKRSSIRIDPDLNIRDLSTEDNAAHVEWLASEIETKGFTSIVYLFIVDDKPTISQGHCRMAAIDLLIERGKWDDETNLIPALLEAKGVGRLEIIAGQFTTNGSKALNPREAAANILRIMALVGQDEQRTATLIGRSRSYVAQMLQFNAMAGPEVHAAIEAGEISQTQAATILRKEGAKKGAATIREVVTKAKASGKKKATKRDVEATKPALPSRNLELEMRREPPPVHPLDVQTAAIVLARDFIDRHAFELMRPEDCKEAERIVAELNHALGKPMQMAAE